MSPPEKRARTEESGEGSETQDALDRHIEPEPEPPKELEVDAPASSRPTLKQPVVVHVSDTTLNVLQSVRGNVLKPLTEGGLKYLSAGARASVCIKSGRYFFEVKILEVLGFGESLRIGLAAAGSSLFIGDDADSVCFTMDGSFMHAQTCTSLKHEFWRGVVVGVLVNLDKTSPNANTVSIFTDGVRACQPQPLPSALQGRALYPAVTFKNVSLHLNFGPEAACPLPFRCRMLGGADVADVEISPAPVVPKDGKFDVVCPVGLPGEGAFDWLDAFLEQHPEYTEISDRGVAEWARRSGLTLKHSNKSSRDRLEFNFGIPELDDGSVREALQTVAAVQHRHLVLMDLRNNLLKEERATALQRFPAALWRRVAHIAVGEPTSDFVARTQRLLLQDKQAAADAAFHKRKGEEERARQAAKRQRELERAKRKAEVARKQAQAQEKATLAEEEKANAGSSELTDAAEAKEAPAVVAEAPVEIVVDAEPEEVEEPEKVEAKEDEAPPKVTLDEAEKQLKFRRGTMLDIAHYLLNTSFVKFSVPSVAEGFDDVIYSWSRVSQCEDYLKSWILERKLTTRVEDLVPSARFKSQWSKWKIALKSWTECQKNYRTQVAKADAAKQSSKRNEESKNDAPSAQPGEEGDDAAAVDLGQSVERTETVVDANDRCGDFDAVDIFGVDDVSNIGHGVPLFRDFDPEDWAMLGLRGELYLLCHAFVHDVEDPERVGIPAKHLDFYYKKYYRDVLAPKAFGVENVLALLALVGDTVFVSTRNVIETIIPDELEEFGIFVRLTEEARRQRNLLVDAGNESARLNIKLEHRRPKGSSGYKDDGGWKGMAGMMGKTQAMMGKAMMGKTIMSKGAGKWNDRGWGGTGKVGGRSAKGSKNGKNHHGKVGRDASYVGIRDGRDSSSYGGRSSRDASSYDGRDSRNGSTYAGRDSRDGSTYGGGKYQKRYYDSGKGGGREGVYFQYDGKGAAGGGRNGDQYGYQAWHGTRGSRDPYGRPGPYRGGKGY